MKIYIAHSRKFDFKGELYAPLIVAIGKQHELILPHANSDEPYPSQKLFEDAGCDIVLAEISWPSTGLGIELGWAVLLKIPVYGLRRDDSAVSDAVLAACKSVITYSDYKKDLGQKVEQLIPSIG